MQHQAPLKKLTTKNVAQLRAALKSSMEQVGSVVRGHSDTIELVFAAILARGHVLLEDVPGVGKTTLARAVARVLGHSFARIQFTSDMLPGDVLGIQVLDPASGELNFRPGPIMHQLVLADEINRASPRTQSALLEAMAERAVTLDDTRHELDSIFTVIATQNPVEHHGAYPLPESQLDRFMISLNLGYPGREAERELLFEPGAPQERLGELESCLEPHDLAMAQELADAITLSTEVADYTLEIIEATRSHADVLLGASPRCAIALVGIARARAWLDERDYVLPDDIKALLPAVLGHRLVLAGAASGKERAARSLLDEILGQVVVPR